MEPKYKNRTKISLVYLKDIEDHITFIEINDFAYVVDTQEFAIRLRQANPTKSGLDGVIFLEGLDKLKELYDIRLNTLAQLLGESNIDNVVALLQSITSFHETVENKLDKNIGVTRNLSIGSDTFVINWLEEDGTPKEVELPINDLFINVDFDRDTGGLTFTTQGGDETKVFIGVLPEIEDMLDQVEDSLDWLEYYDE